MTTNMPKKIGIITSILLGVIFTTAATCFFISIIWPGTDSKLVSLLSNTWLIRIFVANFIGVETNPLRVINIFDISIITLFILVCFSIFKTFKNQYKFWFLIAISLLILGIVIFIITHLAGRSAFMLSGLIISIIFLTKRFHFKIAGSTGIIANLLLLVGDFSVGTNLIIFSALVVFGYILLIIWFFMIANLLFKTEN
jgi:hypothetical protein